jgi:catabolite repression protein CreC
VPGSASLFLVSHADGTIIVYEKDREDGPFTPRTPPTGVSSPLSHPHPQTPNNPLSASTSGDGGAPSHDDYFEGPWDPMDDMFVTPNHAGGAVGLNEKGPSKKNPVSHWRVSKKSILGAWSEMPGSPEED